MSKIKCFNNTKLEDLFNNIKAAEEFEENAAIKTIKSEYDSILLELNSVKEELGMPIEESSITTVEVKAQEDYKKQNKIFLSIICGKKLKPARPRLKVAVKNVRNFQ